MNGNEPLNDRVPDPSVAANRYTGAPKWNWGTILFVLVIHAALFVGLIRALAPNLVAGAMETVESLVTVTVTVPEEPEPEPTMVPTPEPDAGAEGAAGERATPREVVAPEPRVTRSASPAPRASSTGTANQSGASESGSGTGSGNSGDGTGGGGTGSGSGAVGIATRPSVRSGSIDQARDFPIPAGGRETRFGTRVEVIFTVATDGMARGCSVARSTADADTTARVCPLVMQKVRFNPAVDNNGNAVEARYGYRVDFTAR